MCTPEVDAYWAAVFRCSPEDLWPPGVTVTPHAAHLATYDGVFIFNRGDACRVSAPPDMIESLNDVLRGRAVPDVLRGDPLVEMLDDQVVQVIGPNWHGYVSPAGFRPAAGPRCRRITEADASAIAVLRDACSPSDWTEASLDNAQVLFGCFDDRRLVAASCLTGWRGGDDRIGVVTHPDMRGRGYGTAVASAATECALRTACVAEWRARGTNTASINVAWRLGFAPYGENLAVRLR